MPWIFIVVLFSTRFFQRFSSIKPVPTGRFTSISISQIMAVIRLTLHGWNTIF